MFLDLLKKLSLKNTVKSNFAKNQAPSDKNIATVGLLVDGTKFGDVEKLIEEFVTFGIDKKYIKALVFTNSKSLQNTPNIVYFSSKEISLSGEISNQNIIQFTDYSFDMLVNYFTKDQINLLLLASKSKAKFRVGFPSDEKMLNHFMIDLNLLDYKLFASELFKYLKILNKI